MDVFVYRLHVEVSILLMHVKKETKPNHETLIFCRDFLIKKNAIFFIFFVRRVSGSSIDLYHRDIPSEPPKTRGTEIPLSRRKAHNPNPHTYTFMYKA